MAQVSDNVRGALLMAGAMTAFTVNDAFLKLLGETLPLFQVLVLRGVMTVICLGLLARAMGQFVWRLPPGAWSLVLLRTGAECAAAWFFITALFHMDIANLSAILQALPLTVSLAGALFLGEAVGWRRLTAILIGFLGVMLIVRPGTEGFTIHALYGLGAVACVTVRDLAARRFPAGVPTLFASFVAACGITLFGIAGSAVTDWAPVSPRDWAYLAASASFVLFGYVFSVAAMRVGEIGFVAPFRYTSLLVALVLGWAIFGTFPDALTLFGAAIVVATGLFTIWREMQTRRRPPPVQSAIP